MFLLNQSLPLSKLFPPYYFPNGLGLPVLKVIYVNNRICIHFCKTFLIQHHTFRSHLVVACISSWIHFSVQQYSIVEYIIVSVSVFPLKETWPISIFDYYEKSFYEYFLYRSLHGHVLHFYWVVTLEWDFGVLRQVSV